MPRIQIVSGATRSPLFGDADEDDQEPRSPDISQTPLGQERLSQKSHTTLGWNLIGSDWTKRLSCSLKSFGFRFGIFLYLVVCLSGAGGEEGARAKAATGALALLMIVWWLTEAVPLVCPFNKRSSFRICILPPSISTCRQSRLFYPLYYYQYLA